MKKALIVTNLIGFVGFLRSDIKLLKEMGYEVTVAANCMTAPNPTLVEKLNKIGVSVVHLGFSSKKAFAKENRLAYKVLKRLIKTEKYDLVHCHTPIAGFFARMAARKIRRKGTKVIYTTHGLAFTNISSKKQWFMYYWFEKIASKFTDTVITINKEDFENAKKLWCKDVRYISGVGVETARYSNIEIDVNDYKKQLGIPTDKIIVLSVGELSKRKNHQIIIKALAKLENKADYVYVICGKEVAGSGFADMLKELAKEYGVELYLLGHRGDIPQIMHCSDIGAIPSIREGLGFAGIQSLCAGVPLVGTAVQGIKDYIFEGKTGFLCPPHDADAYAKAIVKLSDKQTKDSMRQACFETAKLFDIKISEEQRKNIYYSVLPQEV